MGSGAPFALSGVARGIRPFRLAEMLMLAQRPGVLSLALGLPDPDLLPAADLGRITAQLLAQGPASLQYQFSLNLLRQQVVALAAQRGVRCAPEQVFLTHGTNQSMELVTRLLLDPGDLVAAESVTYEGLVAVAQSQGLPVAPLATSLEAGIDLEALAARLHSGWRPKLLYVMPTGHNPLGVSLDLAARQRLTQLILEHQLAVLEDDAYGFLTYEDNPPPALAALAPTQVFHAGSFSKILAPGLRLSWLIVPPAYASATAGLKRAADLNAADLSQHLASAFITEGLLEPHIARVRATYASKCRAALAALEAHMPAAIRWSRPTSGMFVWLELPPGFDSSQVLAEAVAAEQVAFSPGEIFAASPSAEPSRALRLCFVSHSPARLSEGIERLARVLHRLVAAPPAAVNLAPLASASRLS